MKVEGWDTLLNKHIEDAGEFVWGANDCALWSADWISKATGRNFTSDWAGLYDSEESLQTLLATRGYADASGIADAHLQPVALAFAERGDILLHPSGALGICNGLKGHFLTMGGMLTHNTLRCVKAWKV